MISYRPLSSAKKIFLLSAFTCLIIFQSCKKSHSDIGQVVFKETRNKVFKDVETDAFIEKSVTALFDLMGRQPLDSGFDLLRFLLPRALTRA